MCLGNSVSTVRICSLSVAYVIILNSLNYDNMIVIGKCERMSGNSPAAVLHFWSITRQSSFMMKGDYLVSLPAFLYLLSLFWSAVMECIPDWKWRRNFSQGNATFAFGRWKIIKKSGEYNCWTCSITSTLFYRPKFILPSLMVVPCIFSNDAKLVVIGKMCWSYLPKRMPNFYWPA